MDLSAKKELRWLSAVLSDVEEAAPEADFLIVGAMARDLLLHYGHGVPITRATTDIDLGVTVGSWDEFRQLRDACLESARFTSGRPGSHRSRPRRLRQRRRGRRNRRRACRRHH